MPDGSRFARDPRVDPADLDELGRAYLAALAWRDWRARDRHLVRLRTNLGAILALLGWPANDAATGDPPGPGIGT
ncbi:hypothetical protein [Methylobacterium sp. CCH5-D2]|uniref:hypothetical protein n=1 Tax=Methylobacterium sp. CCH5-D2 TaxID=1768765 RepID=UPI0008353C12|nr:hypothetical protein [Methylobacterium sp. CCH5-D2]